MTIIPVFLATTDPVGFDVWSMITASGPLGLSVMVVLLGMSLASWAIIVLKYRHLAQATRQSKAFIDVFWQSRDLEEVQRASQEYTLSPVAQLFAAGYAELHRGQRADSGSFVEQIGGFENIERALQRTAVAEMTKLERLITFLATTGSAAPFIGLFGTVVGIIRAFQHIGESGSASLATVAPGISEALVVTAVGLAAAIPAVIAYNAFLSTIKVLRSEMESFSGDYLNIVKRHYFSGKAKQ
jgi:biopolymer transport protein TolQ